MAARQSIFSRESNYSRMMATTHGFVGLALASLTVLVAPSLAVPAAVGGLAGGIFPDFDMWLVHRRTLHFPAYYSVLGVAALGVAAVWPSPVTAGAAAFVVAAAVHSASDVLGGSPEAKPWEATSSKGVYLHAKRRWLRARRVIRYDGSPEDFAIGAAFAVPGLVLYDGPIAAAVVVGLLGSMLYTVFREEIGEFSTRWED
jgi:hypothetical protein